MTLAAPYMPQRAKHPRAPKAHTYLFISLAVIVALGGGLLLVQSAVIDALNSTGLLAEPSRTP